MLAAALRRFAVAAQGEEPSTSPTGCPATAGSLSRVGAPQGSGPHYLLGGPKGGLGLLVHLPDVVVLDGEDHEAAGVFPQQRLLLRARGGDLRFLSGAMGRAMTAQDAANPMKSPAPPPGAGPNPATSCGPRAVPGSAVPPGPLGEPRRNGGEGGSPHFGGKGGGEGGNNVGGLGAKSRLGAPPSAHPASRRRRPRPAPAPLTGSGGSWKILRAVLLASTRVPLRLGGCGETRGEGQPRPLRPPAPPGPALASGSPCSPCPPG